MRNPYFSIIVANSELFRALAKHEYVSEKDKTDKDTTESQNNLSYNLLISKKKRTFAPLQNNTKPKRHRECRVNIKSFLINGN